MLGCLPRPARFTSCVGVVGCVSGDERRRRVSANQGDFSVPPLELAVFLTGNTGRTSLRLVVRLPS